MDIILYLTELLQSHKTIGIVGLGTFYKKKTPGRYDASLHVFVPPSYQLAFTPEIKEDVELSKYISTNRNITIDSANYYISEFAEQIQAQIADHQEADLGEIGKLKSVNDEIILIADQEQNFGFEFFGLPTLPEINLQVEETSVDAPSADEEILEEIEEENRLEEENPGYQTNDVEDLPEVDDQIVYDEIAEVDAPQIFVEPIVDQTPIIETEEIVPTTIAMEQEDDLAENDVEEETKKGTPFFLKFLIVLLAIIVVGAIAYFINPKFFDKYIQQNFESKPTKNVPSASIDSLKNKIDSAQTDSLAKNNDLVTLVKDSTAIDSTKMIYEVLGTSESSAKAADAYIARVAKKGINAKQIRFSKQQYSVSLGTFNDEKQAVVYQDSVRILLKNPEIWIKKIKPKKPKK
jgi:nucleoid DNA-binding protein